MLIYLNTTVLLKEKSFSWHFSDTNWFICMFPSNFELTVLTACYLINRVLSSILNGKTFLNSLSWKTTVWFTSKSFWVCVFCSNSQKNHDKLDPQAIQCVFLGYSRTQKGYHCWNHVSKNYVIYTDVTFYFSPSICSTTKPSTTHVTLPVPLEDSPQL